MAKEKGETYLSDCSRAIVAARSTSMEREIKETLVKRKPQ